MAGPGAARKDKMFFVLAPAFFLKSKSISADAKVLRAVIQAYTNRKTGVTYVAGKRVERILGWGRRRRERAQVELCRMGWLKLEWARNPKGVFLRRLYRPVTIARFERNGTAEERKESASSPGEEVKCDLAGFHVRIPGQFLVDRSISSDAKALYLVIAAGADGGTGYMYGNGIGIQAMLRSGPDRREWGRGRREKAQRELYQVGRLRLERKRGVAGEFGARFYRITEPSDQVSGLATGKSSTNARFERSGETGQFIGSRNPESASSWKCDNVIEMPADRALENVVREGLLRYCKRRQLSLSVSPPTVHAYALMLHGRNLGLLNEAFDLVSNERFWPQVSRILAEYQKLESRKRSSKRGRPSEQRSSERTRRAAATRLARCLRPSPANLRSLAAIIEEVFPASLNSH